MKNLFLLPTNPNDETGGGIWVKKTRDWCNIYITSDEEIKEGDWFYNILSLKPEPFKACENGDGYVNCSKYSHYRIDCKKIILTTDQDLIADGVQAIDDEFLEWFVKNPSCEEVQVDKFISGRYFVTNPMIQQEEPKCTCSKGKGIDFDEMGLAYCVSCQKEIN